MSGPDASLFQAVDGEPTKRELDFNSAAVIEALEENPNKKEFSFNVIATDGGTIAKSYSEAFSFVDAGTIVKIQASMTQQEQFPRMALRVQMLVSP